MTRKHLEVILYLEDGWTEEKAEQVCTSKKSVKKYAIIRHDHDLNPDGTPIKPHLHVYINCGKTSVNFKNVAAWFNTTENMVCKIKGTMFDVINYYPHGSCDDKHHYSVDDIVANFDVKAFLEEHARKASVDHLIELCANGTITPLNYTEHISGPVYAANERKIQSAWKYASDLRSVAAQGTCERTIIWLYGDTMVGKGVLCKMIAQSKKLPIYFTSTGKDPFGEYHGEPVAVLDDLRPGEPFSFAELLKITDPNNLCSVHSRYRNKELVSSLIFITSPLSPVEFVRQYCLINENGSQLYRRLSEVWYVTTSTITVSKYDVAQETFIPSPPCTNPVPAYLATLPPAPPSIDGNEILALLNQEYAPAPGSISEQLTLFPSTSQAVPSALPQTDIKEVLPF